MTAQLELVIDPGHGGDEHSRRGGSSGNNATGPAPARLKEKDLTLTLARLLRERLRETFHVRLTRDADTNLALAERAAIARDGHADLFLSLHFNGAADPAIDGTEVWVARQASERSRRFAQGVLRRLTLVTAAANRGLREADLGVLIQARHDARTAACLVEVAFLTHPEQAHRLEDKTYLGEIADALADAVLEQARVGAAQAAGERGAAALALPQPVDDERYAHAGVVALDTGRVAAQPVVRTVVDADARIRSGPPAFAPREQRRIPRYTRVSVEETSGDHVRVTGLDGTDYGWTAASNLGDYFKDDPALASAPLAPQSAVTLAAAWTQTQKAVARTFNRLGGLMQLLATRTRIDPAAVLAVWHVESGGRSHTVDQAVIRFENHLLFERWGSQHGADFDAHFQFGGRAPAIGAGCEKPWKCHKVRTGTSGAFEDVHQNQASEYRALATATTEAGETLAIQCISIGGPQILGSHHRLIGYGTPRQMLDAFQAGERAHVLGFFDYCQFVRPHGQLLDALRRRDWRSFATGYNGSGREDQYAAELAAAFDAATSVLATRPAAAQALDLALDSASVDLHYPVALVPQGDKLSCWAAAMAMLVGQRRGQGMTAEALAREVGRSLRTSYDWDMLQTMRRHYRFREVSLPSNLSFVPPPSDWHRWLADFGPLWVTVSGNPSHAIVVAGIAGDLTPEGSFMHTLNPWDDRVRFDADAVEFHPPNGGHESTQRFDAFARSFGALSLNDYGHWRVLYLPPASEASGLAAIDLPPEALFDAEVSTSHAAGLDVDLSAARPPLRASDARWADDAHSIDYRHLGAAGRSQAFAFTGAVLERLCRLNRFDVAAGQDQVLVGLRGCHFADGTGPVGFASSVQLEETIPDHQSPRCLVGLWKRSTGELALFTGSTVPNSTLMEHYRQGGDHANLLPTGRYLYRVGTHRKGKPSEVPGVFCEGEPFVVLRTLDDLEYRIGDLWDSGDFGDNIHPARLDQRDQPPYFSSAGCQTLPGNFRDGEHTGRWAALRAAAGLSANSPASEDGRRFVYVLLTGRDARLAAGGADDRALARLRFGSAGVDVTAIQLRLRALGHLRDGAQGVFDAATKMAYLHFQQARDAATADGVVTPSDAASLGVDLIAGRSIAVTHALADQEAQQLDQVRAPSNDEIVAQLDASQGTHHANYAGYRATLVNGTVFGHAVTGLTSGFLAKLRRAEADAARAMGSTAFALNSIGGYRAGDGMHNWGLAIDINYDGLPYVMHERGEAALDRELGPVYTRIACLVLHRASVVPRDITQGSRSASRTSTLYDRLAEESDAMTRYFASMGDMTALAAAIRAVPAGFDWQPVSGSNTAPSADALQSQMMADYVTLAGRAGPPVSGKSYPAARRVARSTSGNADRPFATSTPAVRAPELGFINIRKEIVVALSAAGLRWGAIDFGAESGDVMHFDDRLGEGAAIAAAKAAAQAAISPAGQSLQAGNGGCTADVPIDEHVALIFSAEAPLAALVDCDHSAVWTYTPEPRPAEFSVLFYFHGNDACVTVDAQHPGGRLPAWNRVRDPDLHRYAPGGPFTPGVKYDIGGAVQRSRRRPVVLIPEIGVADGWAKTNAGTLGPDRASLARAIDDAWGHLARLDRPAGTPYLEGGPACPLIKRLFLAGHSGGGVALGPAAAAHIAHRVPTDLWLLDCTYSFGVDQHYIDFARAWKSAGLLGNGATASRIVLVAGTVSRATTDGAAGIIQRLRAGWRDAGGDRPGFAAVRFAGHRFCAMNGVCPADGITPAPGTEIVEVMEDASWSEIDMCLRRFPVVFIHTVTPHDEIPLRYLPPLLATAA